MHKGIKLFVAVTGLFAAACNDTGSGTARKDGYSDQPRSKEDSLYQEVIEGHDIGMARIGRLRKYVGQVQQRQDSIGKLPAAQQDKQYLQALASLKDELINADQGMNTWMDAFKPDSAKGNESLRLQYLGSEKVKVTQVKEQILNSLHRADSLLLK